MDFSRVTLSDDDQRFLEEARDFLRTAPHVSIFPGLTILMTVLGLNLLGDGLRDVLDPQSS